jgi:DNA polymerase III subunit epsilon
MRKILWIDTETTGVDPTLHSIIEIAGIIDIDGAPKRYFDFFVAPHPDFEIDEKACAVHGNTIEEMKEFPQSPIVHKQLISVFGEFVDKFNKIDKFIIAGQNIKFDLDMLSHFFMRQGDSYLGSWIDFKKRIELYDITKALQSLGFIESDSLSLGPICKEFGVKIKAHSAASDINSTREVYYKIINNLKWEKRQ